MQFFFPSSRRSDFKLSVKPHVIPYRPVVAVAGPTIVIRGPVDSSSSYGLHLQAVASDLMDFGFNVYIINSRPMIDQAYGRVDPRIFERVIMGDQVVPLQQFELVIAPMDTSVAHPRTVYCTMHESSFLPPNHVGNISKAEMLIVPCQWNVDTYQSHLPRMPINLIPLGIKTDIFTPKAFRQTGKFIFGTAGRYAMAGGRKKPEQVIEAFLKAFPVQEDVELRIKCYPDCPVAEPEDPRVVMTRDFMSEINVADWLAGIHCFVNVSAGEAFGLWILQAMATARGVISHDFGGPATFLAGGTYFPVPYQKAQANGPYYFGDMASVKTDDLIQVMQHVYRMPREGFRTYAMNAAQHAMKFSWRASNLELARLLVTGGYTQWP